MEKGTITLSGSTVGTKMESLEVEQGATGGVAGLFKVDNNDTDKVAMSIEAANIDADVLDVSMDAVTTAKGIDITADGLTTGGVLYVDSDSSSTGTRSLATIINNNTAATGTTGLTLQSDAGRGLFIDSNLAAGGPSIEIDSEKTTTNCVSINADPSTTGYVMDVSADGLTTGGALKIDSDSSSTGTRSIASIIQNHASATGSTALTLQADAGRGLFIDSNLAAGGPSIEIDSEHTTTNCVSINSDPTTTGTVIDISADGLTTGSALKIDSDSSSNATRNIVEIIQNHASATGSTALKVQQDSTGTGSALIVDSESESSAGLTTNGKMAFVSTQDIAGGYAAVFQRNIAEAGSNPLVQFIDNHTSNTQTTLKVQQDGSGAAAVFEGGRVRVTKGGAPFQTALHHSWVMGG